VAARYRMSVDELAQQYGLDICFDRSANSWLLISTVCDNTIDRLSAFARLDPESLRLLQSPQGWSERRPQLSYCPTCLFLNPLDVTSPRWKREWLDPSATDCAVHAAPLRRLPITSLRMCRNFDFLLRLTSRRERHRQAFQR